MGNTHSLLDRCGSYRVLVWLLTSPTNTQHNSTRYTGATLVIRAKLMQCHNIFDRDFALDPKMCIVQLSVIVG